MTNTPNGYFDFLDFHALFLIIFTKVLISIGDILHSKPKVWPK